MTKRKTDPSRRSQLVGASRWTARRLAYEALTAWQQRQAYAGRVLEDLFAVQDELVRTIACKMEDVH